MGGRKKEEETFILQIQEYKKNIRASLQATLSQEREERHKKGEVFFEGCWIPRDKATEIQKHLVRKGKIVFWEVNVLVFIIILLNFFLWRIFKNFLLP